MRTQLRSPVLVADGAVRSGLMRDRLQIAKCVSITAVKEIVFLRDDDTRNPLAIELVNPDQASRNRRVKMGRHPIKQSESEVKTHKLWITIQSRQTRDMLVFTSGRALRQPICSFA